MVETGIDGRTSDFMSGVQQGSQTTGSRALSAEELRILTSADLRRVLRNSARARRRTEDEGAEVSEDEPDEFGDLVRRHAEEGTRHGDHKPNVRVGPGTLPGLEEGKKEDPLFKDSDAQQNVFTAHDETIPEEILTLVKCR